MGHFRSALFGIGCGCVYPIAAALVFVILCWFFLAEPLHLISTPSTLPDFSGPEQEDFWSLQEKRLDLENTASPTLSLTPAEFNAYLSAWQIPPVSGFCLQRTRFVAGDGRGTFYLIGSGFGMRNVVIQIEISKVGLRLLPGKIQINSWPVPLSGWVRTRIDTFLHNLLSIDPNGLPVRFLDGRAIFDFSANNIVLSGTF